MFVYPADRQASSHSSQNICIPRFVGLLVHFFIHLTMYINFSVAYHSFLIKRLGHLVTFKTLGSARVADGMRTVFIDVNLSLISF